MEQKRKVLIDGRWAGDTGIGRLFREVMQAAPQQVDCHYIQTKAGLGNMFSPVSLARDIARSDGEIFYSPSFMPPLYSKMPYVFTVHDLMHLFYYSTMHRIYYRQVIARLATRAKQVITVSHFSKAQLVSLLGIPEELVTVIYNGVDDHFLANQEASSLGRPYFLYIGNRRANKNLPAMLEAFAHAHIPKDYVFALSGKSDPQLNALIQDLGIEKRVQFLGYIPEEELPKVYKGAYATLFVSKMEGFGLPVLESMASGTPVLTSTKSSLPEIAGGAALCANPADILDIQQGIERLVSDQGMYEGFVERGLKRARQFPWSRTAEQTWKLILS
ncbi:glycosyltransferase family 4 protein [Echinicola soli]|uniref:Glycosyltransferase family 4 protein n=1 Tax=Echinicola soli TaxID=2591634 RepID=A0A514CMU6_9BACT|nr:glycosyltransferase family 1 protein [Echinicola soli]QDH81110.1 glycosyltransferase family 4 protein [Echinicola soli]